MKNGENELSWNISRYIEMLKRIRDRAVSAIIFGIVIAIMGIFLKYAVPLRIFLVLVGAFLIGEAIWMVMSPKANKILLNGIGIIIAGLWNISIPVMSLIHGKVGISLIWGLIGIILVIWGSMGFRDTIKFRETSGKLDEKLKDMINRTHLTLKETLKLSGMHVALISALFTILFPAYWVLAASFKKGGSLFSTELFPTEYTLENYYKLLTKTKFLIWMQNTVVLCVCASLLALVVTVTAGYAFSRMRFPGRKWGLMTMIVIQMFPAAMAMVAIYKLLLYLGKVTGGAVGLNTISGLILVYAGGGIPFNTWIIKGYLDGLPKELEESAYIDGATQTQAFVKVILPLLMPILAVVTIFNFIGPYADFLFPSIVLTGETKFTLAVGMRSFITGSFSTNWTQFAAASILGALPILVIFFSLQKFLVEGLTKGALKG